MQLTESIPVLRPPEQVWATITDIQHCAQVITGILSVEVLEQPKDGLVGLKWRETREMFGKAASETMWITHADAPNSYQTRAESHGAVYISGFTLEPDGEHTVLTMSFRGEPQTLSARVMAFLMAPMIKKAMVKVIHQDLLDIKRFVELQ